MCLSFGVGVCSVALMFERRGNKMAELSHKESTLTHGSLIHAVCILLHGGEKRTCMLLFCG